MAQTGLGVDPPSVRRARKNIAALEKEDLKEDHADMPAAPVVQRTETHEPAVSRRLVYALAIPATILGLAGVLLSWLPVLALLSLPLGGLGLLLGIAALVISIVQRGRGIPLALAGSLLSFATLIVAVLQLANAISFLRIGDPTNQSSVETVRSTTPSAISDQEKGAAQGAR